MIKYLVAYCATLLALLVIDGIWLRLVMMPLYQHYLRGLLANTITVWPVVVFYLFYAAGICFFVVIPGLNREASLLSNLGAGFFLGLLAYCAYDLTNLATLRDWPVLIAMLDIFWGGAVTALAGVIGVYSTRLLIK